MTRTDQKILFTSLGFLAVILNDVAQDKQALRAKAIAGLIEGFCMENVPEAFIVPPPESLHPAKTKRLIELYTTELRATGSAVLNYDRKTLLDMYEVLLTEKVWHEQQEFFTTGHEELIASRILQLVEEKMQWEEQP